MLWARSQSEHFQCSSVLKCPYQEENIMARLVFNPFFLEGEPDQAVLVRAIFVAILPHRLITPWTYLLCGWPSILGGLALGFSTHIDLVSTFLVINLATTSHTQATGLQLRRLLLTSKWSWIFSSHFAWEYIYLIMLQTTRYLRLHTR